MPSNLITGEEERQPGDHVLVHCQVRGEQQHQVELQVGLHPGVDAAHQHPVVLNPQLARHRSIPFRWDSVIKNYFTLSYHT